MTTGDREAGRYASPPCLAGEIAPGYFDPLGVDPEQARDVTRWRKSERARLRAARQKLGVAERLEADKALARHLRDVMSTKFGGAKRRVLSAYWPIKGEPDLRSLLRDLHETGVVIAMPVVDVKAAPLVFRLWTPDTRMVRGDWGIPVPPAGALALVPDVTLAPLVGWDADGYRLGYGGGYFDRTLAALSPRPFTIGIGFQTARLATIYPQPHDIPLDVILTETGTQFIRETS